MVTLTPQSRHSATLTAQVRQTGASLAPGMAIGLLLALTYSTMSGQTALTPQSRNSVTLTATTKN